MGLTTSASRVSKKMILSRPSSRCCIRANATKAARLLTKSSNQRQPTLASCTLRACSASTRIANNARAQRKASASNVMISKMSAMASASILSRCRNLTTTGSPSSFSHASGSFSPSSLNEHARTNVKSPFCPWRFPASSSSSRSW